MRVARWIVNYQKGRLACCIRTSNFVMRGSSDKEYPMVSRADWKMLHLGYGNKLELSGRRGFQNRWLFGRLEVHQYGVSVDRPANLVVCPTHSPDSL